MKLELPVKIEEKKRKKGKKKSRIIRIGKIKIKVYRRTKYIFLGVVAALIIAAAVFLILWMRGKSKEQEAMDRLDAHRIEQLQKAQEAQNKKKAGAKDRIACDDALQHAWEDMWLKEIELTEDNTYGFVTMDTCNLSEESPDQIIVEGTLPGIPKSDSDDIYLFAMNTYETELSANAEPIDTYRIEKTKATFSFSADLNNKKANNRLFKKFVVAAKKDGKYEILCKSRYITNPEMIAKYNTYTKASSIKGLLVDPNKLHSGELEDLGVKQAAYNIPLARIMGQTSSGNYPTIAYNYNGKTYAFDGQSIAEFDIVFGALSAKGIRVTAILLNDMNGAYPELIHPQARSGGSAPYYMFNGTDEAGINCMAAAATFLAERYSGTGHGTISNWVIANEINARKEWNYMEYTDVNTYTKEYAQAFRVFYNAIKGVNGSAKIYMPLDQTWNRNLSNSQDYDARDVLDAFNTIISDKGNIDWHLSHHPYPVPLTNAAFWNTGAYYNKLIKNSSDSPMICMKNINVVTDYLEQESMLTDSGEVRSVLLSELGFTSSSGGEGVQAAAFAYAYYIAEANSHIDGLLLNRETDAPVEVGQGLAFGLCNAGGGRKQIYNVFKQIDTANSKQATEFAKGVIGIGNWSDVIRNY